MILDDGRRFRTEGRTVAHLGDGRVTIRDAYGAETTGKRIVD